MNNHQDIIALREIEQSLDQMEYDLFPESTDYFFVYLKQLFGLYEPSANITNDTNHFKNTESEHLMNNPAELKKYLRSYLLKNHPDKRAQRREGPPTDEEKAGILSACQLLEILAKGNEAFEKYKEELTSGSTPQRTPDQRTLNEICNNMIRAIDPIESKKQKIQNTKLYEIANHANTLLNQGTREELRNYLRPYIEINSPEQRRRAGLSELVDENKKAYERLCKAYHSTQNENTFQAYKQELINAQKPTFFKQYLNWRDRKHGQLLQRNIQLQENLGYIAISMIRAMPFQFLKSLVGRPWQMILFTLKNLPKLMPVEARACYAFLLDVLFHILCTPLYIYRFISTLSATQHQSETARSEFSRVAGRSDESKQVRQSETADTEEKDEGMGNVSPHQTTSSHLSLY